MHLKYETEDLNSTMNKLELKAGTCDNVQVQSKTVCNVSCHRVSLKHTLKKKGRAFRNIGKIYFPDLEISVGLFFRLICSTIFFAD